MFSAIVFALLSVASAQYSYVDLNGNINKQVYSLGVPALTYNTAGVELLPQLTRGVVSKTYGDLLDIQRVVPQTYVAELNNRDDVQRVIQIRDNFPKVVPQTYVSNFNRDKVFEVRRDDVQRVVPQTYVSHLNRDTTVQRDYEIEKIGERHAVQSGPTNFQYHFVKGTTELRDDIPRVVEQRIVQRVEPNVDLSHYGVINQYGGAKLRVQPVARKVVDVYGRQLIK